jgi:hypothetical protein
MGKAIQKYQGPGGGEIVSLNIDDLDIVELERRLEMAVAAFGCPPNCSCNCPMLVSCGTFCH